MLKPVLALVSISKELLDEEEVGDGTKELLTDVYHEEYTVEDT